MDRMERDDQMSEKENKVESTSSSMVGTTNDEHDPQSRSSLAIDSEKEATPSLSPSHRFPDGGREAWTVVLGGWCCVFVSFGWIVCIGSFQSYYQNNQLRAYPPSTVAWIPSTEVAMMFFGSPFYGAIFDRFGPRSLLLIGTFLHIFGLMMTSLATEYYQFLLAQSFCSGLGACALFLAANNCIGTWFDKKRGLVFGIVTSGSSISGTLLPYVFPLFHPLNDLLISPPES